MPGCLHPLGGAGVGAFELAGQRSQLLEGAVVIVLGPGSPEPAIDGGPVAFGQVVEHVAFLVTDAALHGHLAEHGADPLRSALAPSITNSVPCSGSRPRSREHTDDPARDGQRGETVGRS